MFRLNCHQQGANIYITETLRCYNSLTVLTHIACTDYMQNVEDLKCYTMTL